jgi:LysR family transcriptional regulator (chromosome initiation inhibitor)
MLDYKGIEALHTVQELQSFEAAAKKLNITQSAISQRIKSLEIYYGEPLLIRTLPYRCTPLGSQLIGHFKRICLLEKDLEKQLGATAKPSFSVALNRDSLETWFMDAIKTPIFQALLVEIVADDQERTLDYLKKGRVSACISTSEKEIVGGKVDFVGNMEYVLVASPEFVSRYFSQKTSESFRSAPALKFDQNDSLHERYLEKFFGLNAKEFDYHVVPSVKGFKQFVLLGYGYGLIPKIDIVEELKKKQLVEIYPDKNWQISLYWHYWAVESPLYRKFNEEMIRQAKRKLNYEKF